MVAKFWLWGALTETDFKVYYVESHANIADGPTRARLGPLQQAGGQEIAPVLPPRACDLWAFPSLDNFAQQTLQSLERAGSKE